MDVSTEPTFDVSDCASWIVFDAFFEFVGKGLRADSTVTALLIEDWLIRRFVWTEVFWGFEFESGSGSVGEDGFEGGIEFLGIIFCIFI